MSSELSSIETAGKRIAYFRASQKLSQQALADEIGVSRSYVASIEIDRIEPSREFLKKLYQRFNVSAGWVLYGGDDIYARPDTSPGLALPGDYSPEEWEAITRGKRRKAPKVDVHWIPLFDVRVAAGSGAIQTEEIIDKALAFRADWIRSRHLSVNSLALVEVIGDSMEDKLSAGDLVLIDRSQRTVKSGKAYVLRVGDELVVKYLQRLPGGSIQASSHNNEVYPSFEISQAMLEREEVEIIGRVVASQHIWP